jgi:hypothetical protein
VCPEHGSDAPGYDDLDVTKQAYAAMAANQSSYKIKRLWKKTEFMPTDSNAGSIT